MQRPDRFGRALGTDFLTSYVIPATVEKQLFFNDFARFGGVTGLLKNRLLTACIVIVYTTQDDKELPI
jgi:hypothetical protein